jgi:hypothetical protein
MTSAHPAVEDQHDEEADPAWRAGSLYGPASSVVPVV